MGTVMKQREVFFNNLLILGFDKASIEKEYRTNCDKNMFCVPNQKMFEVVSYFLFSKLNQVSNPKYSVPWPLMDKDQHRQFQKACFNHLSNIAQDSNIKFPRIVSSLLSTFGGDRFYELYLAFSTHVVQCTIIKKDNVSLIMMPTVTNQNTQDVVETLKIATIISVKNFQEVQSFSLNHFNLLSKCARQYVTQIQSLKLSLTTTCSLLKENIDTLKKLFSDTQSEKNAVEVIYKNSIKYEKKVKDLWLSFEKFFIKESKLWCCLSSEVEGNQKKYILNGEDFHYEISDKIKGCCPELNEIEGIGTSENEKLNLIRHLKTFLILLEFYTKTSIKGEKLQISELCFNKNISRLEESLKHIQSLNDNLVTNILPSIKDSSQKLEANSLLEEFSEDLEIFLKECPSWSCCSKNFQENISSFRSQKGDAYSSSLLVNDASMHFSEDLSKRHRFDAIAISSDLHPTDSFPSPIHSSKSNPLLTDETSIIPENTLKPSNSLESNVGDSNFQKDLIENSLTDASSIHTGNMQSIPQHNIDDFVVDIDSNKPFKLRESWQNEESLSAMTLEDLSGLE